MRDMTNFTIRYDVIRDTNITDKYTNESFKNFRYFSDHSNYDTINPCNVTLDELLTILLIEIKDRDDIIKGVNH